MLARIKTSDHPLALQDCKVKVPHLSKAIQKSSKKTN
jgi:hypothetical protein